MSLCPALPRAVRLPRRRKLHFLHQRQEIFVRFGFLQFPNQQLRGLRGFERPQDPEQEIDAFQFLGLAAAGLQAGLLIVLCGFIGWEAVGRFMNPTAVEAGPMLLVGVIGLVANVISMSILFGGRGASLNMKAAFLEVSADALAPWLSSWLPWY